MPGTVCAPQDRSLRGARACGWKVEHRVFLPHCRPPQGHQATPGASPRSTRVIFCQRRRRAHRVSRRRRGSVRSSPAWRRKRESGHRAARRKIEDCRRFESLPGVCRRRCRRRENNGRISWWGPRLPVPRSPPLCVGDGSINASTGPRSTNFTALPSAKRCIVQSMSCRPIWMRGLRYIMKQGHISRTVVLRQNPDADVPGCDANDEGENDRGLTATDTKT
jgi:hypothetical protein